MKKSITLIFLLVTILTSCKNFQSDKNIKVITKYYSLLKDKNTVKEAYEISPRDIPYEIFYKQYLNILDITLGEITRNENGAYHFQVDIIYAPDLGAAAINKYYMTMQVKDGIIIKSKSKPLEIEFDLADNTVDLHELYLNLGIDVIQ